MIKIKITRQENATYYHANIGDIIDIPLTDYIAGVVASEMGNAKIEAAKAQAIAARTFAYYYYYSKGKEITDSSSIHQAFRATRLTDAYANARQAAIETEGMVLKYNGTVLNSCPYSNSNGGRTVSSQARWGGYRAWLIEQDDPWDKAAGGSGNGHGVGMSQVGCHYAAKIGKTYKQILAFYYPGTVIDNDDFITKVEEAKKQEMTDMATSSTVIKVKDFLDKVHIPFDEHWGYIWAGRGQIFTQAAYNAATREQTIKWGKQWIGKHVVDCSGLVYWAFNQLGGYIYHGSNTIWNSYTTVKGKIEPGMKMRPGTAVFLYKPGVERPRHHIGVFIGNDTVIESRGTNYGVIQSKVTDWDEWGQLKGIDYTGSEYEEIHMAYPVIKKGSKGTMVTLLQEKLTELGFLNDKIDGIFGTNTENALISYQSVNGLTADGVCGTQTWNKINSNKTQEEKKENIQIQIDEENINKEIPQDKTEFVKNKLNTLVSVINEILENI